MVDINPFVGQGILDAERIRRKEAREDRGLDLREGQLNVNRDQVAVSREALGVRRSQIQQRRTQNTFNFLNTKAQSLKETVANMAAAGQGQQALTLLGRGAFDPAIKAIDQSRIAAGVGDSNFREELINAVNTAITPEVKGRAEGAATVSSAQAQADATGATVGKVLGTEPTPNFKNVATPDGLLVVDFNDPEAVAALPEGSQIGGAAPGPSPIAVLQNELEAAVAAGDEERAQTTREAITAANTRNIDPAFRDTVVDSGPIRLPKGTPSAMEVVLGGTGVVAAGKNVLSNSFGQFFPQASFPEIASKQVYLSFLQQAAIQAFASSSRPPVIEQARIANIIPKGGPGESEEDALAKLDTSLQLINLQTLSDLSVANDSNQPITERREAMARVNQLRLLKSLINGSGDRDPGDAPPLPASAGEAVDGQVYRLGDGSLARFDAGTQRFIEVQ